jgi:hypothetical protein
MLKRTIISGLVIGTVLLGFVAAVAVFGGPWDWRKPWQNAGPEFHDLTESDGLFTAGIALKAMEEPSLKVLAENSETISYRFLWLRSFHNPVVVRSYWDRHQDSPRMVMKVSDGCNCMGPDISGPGKFKEARDFEILHSTFSMIVRAFGNMELCDKSKQYSDQSGLDGANWYFEMSSAGRYCWSERWSPGSGPHQFAGEMMLELSGYEVVSDY